MESFYPFYVIMMCFSSEKRFSEVAVCRVFLCNLGLYWINPSVFEQCLFFIFMAAVYDFDYDNKGFPPALLLVIGCWFSDQKDAGSRIC